LINDYKFLPSFFLSFLPPCSLFFLYSHNSFISMMFLSENKSHSSFLNENDFNLMCVVSSPNGKGTFFKLQDGIGIFAMKMKVSNTLNLPVRQFILIYKLEQQRNIIFDLNTDNDVEYLLEVCCTYNCTLVNVHARLSGDGALTSGILPQASQK